MPDRSPSSGQPGAYTAIGGAFWRVGAEFSAARGPGCGFPRAGSGQRQWSAGRDRPRRRAGTGRSRWHESEVVAEKIGTSARTLSRLFTSETQLRFKSWCQRAADCGGRRAAVNREQRLNQTGRSELGYASLPAFSHAFRQVTGRTSRDLLTAVRRNRHDKLLCLIGAHFALNRCNIHPQSKWIRPISNGQRVFQRFASNYLGTRAHPAQSRQAGRRQGRRRRSDRALRGGLIRPWRGLRHRDGQ
ncbi:helix-turn-helix domain-containing protein [Bradyrhizobium sp.]|uniref:helix-turn-helix domain-containing protein n=1 Tax=Bradyrhizobium sp. TaxID=376 RepID=UPI00345DCE1F